MRKFKLKSFAIVLSLAAATCTFATINNTYAMDNNINTEEILGLKLNSGSESEQYIMTSDNDKKADEKAKSEIATAVNTKKAGKETDNKSEQTSKTEEKKEEPKQNIITAVATGKVVEGTNNKNEQTSKMEEKKEEPKQNIITDVAEGKNEKTNNKILETSKTEEKKEEPKQNIITAVATGKNEETNNKILETSKTEEKKEEPKQNIIKSDHNLYFFEKENNGKMTYFLYDRNINALLKFSDKKDAEQKYKNIIDKYKREEKAKNLQKLTKQLLSKESQNEQEYENFTKTIKYLKTLEKPKQNTITAAAEGKNEKTINKILETSKTEKKKEEPKQNIITAVAAEENDEADDEKLKILKIGRNIDKSGTKFITCSLPYDFSIILVDINQTTKIFLIGPYTDSNGIQYKNKVLGNYKDIEDLFDAYIDYRNKYKINLGIKKPEEQTNIPKSKIKKISLPDGFSIVKGKKRMHVITPSREDVGSSSSISHALKICWEYSQILNNWKEILQIYKKEQTDKSKTKTNDNTHCGNCFYTSVINKDGEMQYNLYYKGRLVNLYFNFEEMQARARELELEESGQKNIKSRAKDIIIKTKDIDIKRKKESIQEFLKLFNAKILKISADTLGAIRREFSLPFDLIFFYTENKKDGDILNVGLTARDNYKSKDNYIFKQSIKKPTENDIDKLKSECIYHIGECIREEISKNNDKIIELEKELLKLEDELKKQDNKNIQEGKIKEDIESKQKEIKELKLKTAIYSLKFKIAQIIQITKKPVENEQDLLTKANNLTDSKYNEPSYNMSNDNRYGADIKKYRLTSSEYKEIEQNLKTIKEIDEDILPILLKECNKEYESLFTKNPEITKIEEQKTDDKIPETPTIPEIPIRIIQKIIYKSTNKANLNIMKYLAAKENNIEQK